MSDPTPATTVADIIAGIESQLTKWRLWFPSEESTVGIPRRDLLALVEAAKDRDALLADVAGLKLAVEALREQLAGRTKGTVTP